jgi:hypothetical protein
MDDVWFATVTSAVLLGLAWTFLGGLRMLAHLLWTLPGRLFRLALDAYRSRAHRRYLANLPPPTVAPADVQARAREVFHVICDRAGVRGYAAMGKYFATHGWN